MVFVYHVISHQRFMCFYSQELIQVSYHPAKFGGYRHSGSGDIMVFVCHVTLQDHVIKALIDFMVKSPSR